MAQEPCYSATRAADFREPLAGSWLHVPLAETTCGSGAFSCAHGNRTAWEVREVDPAANKRWHRDACAAEDTQHSCFFHGDPRAEFVATRVWRPSACSFIPLQPESFAEQHALTTITFAGDSMMRQAFISFVCQMRRVAL
eukprot:5445667-Prymnesium_polylepis.1